MSPAEDLETKALQIVQERVGEMSDGAIKRTDKGWNNVVYNVLNQQVFRFPRTAEVARKLASQVRFLNAFAPTSPILVPDFRAEEDSRVGSFVTYNYIPGVPLKTYVDKLGNHQLETIARSLGEFLTALHSFSADQARAFGVEEIEPLSYWKMRLERLRAITFPELEPHQAAWIEKLFANFLAIPDLSSIARFPIHFDLKTEHILVDPDDLGRVTGVIDFDDQKIADRAHDFTYFGTLFKDLGGLSLGFTDIVYQSYELELDPGFEDRRRFYIDRLPVTAIEHVLTLNDPDNLARRRTQLNDYIAAHPY